MRQDSASGWRPNRLRCVYPDNLSKAVTSAMAREGRTPGLHPGLFPGLIRALLLSGLMGLLCVGGAAQPAIPHQVKGVRPCPGIKLPRTVEDSGRRALEVQVPMAVDVDGAPNAYGPPGRKALDILEHGSSLKEPGRPQRVVGYMTEYEGGPPTIQRKGDPYPGYYVSQTGFADKNNPRFEDPRRYVDAAKVNYVVQGRAARRGGVKLGDFAVVYSCRTGRSAYAIVGDSGNESGAEGSLALVQALGYHIVNGIDESVEGREIVIRYFPGSNPEKQFFKTQAELDEAAKKLGLVKDR